MIQRINIKMITEPAANAEYLKNCLSVFINFSSVRGVDWSSLTGVIKAAELSECMTKPSFLQI